MKKPSVRRTRARTTTISVLAAIMLLVASVASAVTVDPPTNDFVLGEGETWTETITVDIPADTAAARVDVYLLADTTGSMGGPITAVKAGAGTIVDGLAAELPDTGLAFGVGDFRDFPTASDLYAFQNSLSITTDAEATKAAIAGWTLGFGGDGPEGQFYAYDQIAENRAPSYDGSPAGTIGWRPGAKRILVTFADAPGHDPICPEITEVFDGHALPYEITETSVTSKLAAAGITFIGVSTNSIGMDGNPSVGDYSSYCGSETTASAGQATRIAEATGGEHLLGVDSTEIVETIRREVLAVATRVDELTLEPAGDIVPFVAGISPEAGHGPFDTEEASIWDFTVDWEGVVAATSEDQVFTGALNVLADGEVIASKSVRITVPGSDGLYPPVPDVEVLPEVLYPPVPDVIAKPTPDVIAEATPAKPVAAKPTYTG